MKCEYCGVDESLPFVCNYCGGVFCPDHRLPETHHCKGDISQKRTMYAPPPRQEAAPPPGYWGSGSQGNFTTLPKHAPGKLFSRIEIRDIAIAWLTLGIAFGVVFFPGGISGLQSFKSPANYPNFVSTYFLIMLVTVGSGFVLHELSHKFAAERYGYWAEFRVWPLGLVLIVVTAIIGFLFAAPGATYIAGANIKEKENAIISLAGPGLNVIVALLFLPFLLTGISTVSIGGVAQPQYSFPWGFLGLVGVYVNTWLGTFNMLPIWILDGSKVFRWNKKVWAAFFFPLLFASIFLIFFLFPYAYNLTTG